MVTTPLSKKKISTTKKGTTSEDSDKGNLKLDYMKEAMVVICGKDSDNFDGHFKGSTGWFNLDNGFFKEIFIHLNRDLKTV